MRLGSLRTSTDAAEVAGLLLRGAARLALVDSVAGLAWEQHGRTRGAVVFTIAHDKIVEFDVIGDPARLRQLDVILVDH